MEILDHGETLTSQKRLLNRLKVQINIRYFSQIRDLKLSIFLKIWDLIMSSDISKDYISMVTCKLQQYFRSKVIQP